MGASASPAHSSPEDFDADDDSNVASSAQWQMHGQPSPNSLSQSQRTSAPLQKRRRVTRACDECRRKKIKCDGKQPCTHCTVYSYGKPLLAHSILKCMANPDALQTAHTTNPRTGEGTPHHNTLKHWRLDCSALKLFSKPCYRKLI